MSLLDLDNDGTPVKNGDTQNLDPFDPFGPSESTESGGDPLLLEFSASNLPAKQQISGNPLYDMSHDDLLGMNGGDDGTTNTSTNSANPLYDLSSPDQHFMIDVSQTQSADNALDSSSESEKEVVEEEVVPMVRRPSSTKEVTTNTLTLEDGTTVTETTTTYTDLKEDGSIVKRKEVVEERVEEEYIESSDHESESNQSNSQSDIEDSQPIRAKLVNATYSDSEDEVEVVEVERTSEGEYNSDFDKSDQESSQDEVVTHQNTYDDEEAEDPLEGDIENLTEEELEERRAKGRTLSKSFEEYETNYQEYKPPKKYVKPLEKEVPGATKTMIMGLPQNVYVAPAMTRQTSNTSDKTNSYEKPIDSPKEIIKAEDKADDGLESCKTLQLGSLKSRFELSSDTAPVLAKEPKRISKASPSPNTRHAIQHNGYHDNVVTSPDGEEREVYKENIEEKDVVSFKEIGKVRSLWEQSSIPDAPVPSPNQSKRQTSRRSRSPERAAPPVVSRDLDSETSDLPTPGTTRSYLDKFKSFESSKEQSEQRRSPHRITPPREEQIISTHVTDQVHATPNMQTDSEPVRNPDIIRAEDKMNEVEELPPSNFTRSMLAKFKQMEVNDRPPPTPERKTVVKATSVRKFGLPTEGQYVRSTSQASANSSIDSIDRAGVHDVYEEGGDYENKLVRRDDVIREEDRNKEAELPEQGLTKNLLAKFKIMETDKPVSSLQPTQGSPVQRRGKSDKSANRSSSLWSTSSTSSATAMSGDPGPTQRHSYHAHHEGSPEGGAYENEPQSRADVIRESDTHNEEELPEQGLTRNLLAKFKTIEKSSPTVPLPESTRRSPHRPTPPRDEPALMTQSRVSNNSDTHSDSGIGEHDGGEFDSAPLRADIIRESDRNDEAELPAPSTTKNLLARFQSMQS